MSEFEKWFTGEEDTKTRRAIMEKDDAGYYKFQSAYNAFLAWQAATAVSDKRIAELEAHINVLHEALGKAMNDEAGWYEIAKQTLSATPAQSLLQHDNEVIERCAKVAMDWDITGIAIAEAIRALKPTS